MIKRCRFCGEKIKSDDASCPHCGKQLIAQSKSSSESETESLVGLNSWESKSVPAWMMFVVIGIAFLCVFAMFNQGCNRDDEPESVPENAAIYRNRTGNGIAVATPNFLLTDRFENDAVI